MRDGGNRRVRATAAAVALLSGGLAVLGAEPARAATITVTTTDTTVAIDGECSLREATQAAGTNTAVDTCPAGSSTEPDVVLLPAGDFELSSPISHIDPAGLTLVGAGPEAIR